MKLLIVTQTVDTEDLVLGFFVSWIAELARHVESIDVICLKKGTYQLPTSVRVHSLGKEQGAQSRIVYARRFLSLAWKLRGHYDSVLVHMNQEYILLAGPLWKMLRKPVYMWRNHYVGSLLTDCAVAFCTKVFCTSRHSYTARFAQTVLMPIGVDTDRFTPNIGIARRPHSILFLGRMAPSKRPEILIDALALLARQGIHFETTIVGSPLPQHESYFETVQERVRGLHLSRDITFLPGVPNHATVDLYRAHAIYINASSSGMFDKTLVEAAACGCYVIAASEDFKQCVRSSVYFATASELAMCLRVARSESRPTELTTFVTANSLRVLGEAFQRELSA